MDYELIQSKYEIKTKYASNKQFYFIGQRNHCT